MLTAAKVLSRVQGYGITLVPSEAGDRLRFHPASALTPGMIDELRRHKEPILKILRRREEVQQDASPLIENAGEVLELARARFKLPEDERFDPPVPPVPPGRDPMVKRGAARH